MRPAMPSQLCSRHCHRATTTTGQHSNSAAGAQHQLLATNNKNHNTRCQNTITTPCPQDLITLPNIYTSLLRRRVPTTALQPWLPCPPRALRGGWRGLGGLHAGCCKHQHTHSQQHDDAAQSHPEAEMACVGLLCASTPRPNQREL